MSRKTAFAGALALALIGLPRPGGAAEAVVLQLSGPAQFEFAGYYAALWQGYYRDAGLDVTIRPGSLKSQAPVDPVREVAEGRAQFGTGTMQLGIRRAQGLPLDQAKVVLEGTGVTLIAYGPMVRTCLESALAARQDGRSIEVVVPTVTDYEVLALTE